MTPTSTTPTPRFLNLARPLAANVACDGADVHDVKTLLAELGHYPAPDWGVSAYPDRALFDAIRAYQAEHGLKADGVMKPGGETEVSLRTLQTHTLRAQAEALRSKGRFGDTILAHISPAEARLLDAVTDGGSINPETGLPEFFDLGGMANGLSGGLIPASDKREPDPFSDPFEDNDTLKPAKPKPPRTAPNQDTLLGSATDLIAQQPKPEPKPAKSLSAALTVQGDDPFDLRTIYAPRPGRDDLGDEIFTANRRLADALLKTADHAAVKPHVLAAWNDGGKAGRDEVRDLMSQLKARDPERGRTFETEMGLTDQQATTKTPRPSANTASEIPGKKARKSGTDMSMNEADSGDASDGLFERYRKNLAPREGGIADRPKHADPGGLTNKGISPNQLNNLRALDRWKHLPESTNDLTDDQINNIYRKEYFDLPQIGKLAKVEGLEKVAPKFAEQIFDSGVLHGIGDAGRWLQESVDESLRTDLRIKDEQGNQFYDGIIGSQTRHMVERAVREGKIKDVNNLIVKKRIEYMKTRPNFKDNPGWILRAEGFYME